jgi:hypothetical protein
MPWQGLSVKDSNQQTINQAIGQLGQGRSNAHGTVTLNVGPATSTTVTTAVCSALSTVHLHPTTANAAASVPTNSVTASNGSFVINHAANANVDRTYNWAVVG